LRCEVEIEQLRQEYELEPHEYPVRTYAFYRNRRTALGGRLRLPDSVIQFSIRDAGTVFGIVDEIRSLNVELSEFGQQHVANMGSESPEPWQINDLIANLNEA
jgi:hypothetical protein